VASATTTGTAAGGTSGKKLKIGMVTDIAKLGDKSFNDSAWAGVQAGARAIGGTTKVIETTDPNDYEKNINQFVSENYDVIVTVGFNLGKQTIAAATANPNIKFIGVDQEQAAGKEVPNVTGLIFEEDKAGFLAGALAASYSKSGKLGAVLGTDAVPAVWRYGEGYRAGAKYIKKDITVQTVYHSDVSFDKTFNDSEWGKATALSMLDKGVDVVFGAGGRTGNGALFAAADRKDKGVVAIGVDVDQYNTVPEAKAVLLSSAMKIIDQGVAGLIKAVADGSIKSGNHTGKVGLAPFHDLDSKVPPDVKAKLEQIRKQLDDRSLKTNVPATKPKS
jgi:basic membrane protein A